MIPNEPFATLISIGDYYLTAPLPVKIVKDEPSSILEIKYDSKEGVVKPHPDSSSPKLRYSVHLPAANHEND